MTNWSITPHYLFCVYLLIISFIGWLQMHIDKYRAKHHRWRISEQSLMFTALFGGAGGIWLGMRTARHKTKKPLFTITVPLLFLLQLVFLVYCFIS